MTSSLISLVGLILLLVCALVFGGPSKLSVSKANDSPLTAACRIGLAEIAFLNKRGNVTREEISEFLSRFGIKLAQPLHGLEFNGGIKFDAKEYLKLILTQGETREFEHTVFKKISNEGETILGLGDESVRKVLLPNLKEIAQLPIGADILSVSSRAPPTFRIREVKSGRIEGWNIPKAVRQIEGTLSSLRARITDASVDLVEVSVPAAQLDVGTELMGGYRIGPVIDPVKQTYQLEQKVGDVWVPSTTQSQPKHTIQIRLYR